MTVLSSGMRVLSSSSAPGQVEAVGRSGGPGRVEAVAGHWQTGRHDVWSYRGRRDGSDRDHRA